MRHVVAIDMNAMYLGAAAQADLGIGSARHITEGCTFDRTLPGLWRLDSLTWEEGDLPSLLTPVTRSAARGSGDRWYATPTVKELAALGYAVRPTEAYVWDEKTRYLYPWGNRLRDARARILPAAMGGDPDALARMLPEQLPAGDPDAVAVQETLKATYTRGLGYHAHQGSGRYYHPEWWHLTVATARANLFRKLNTAAQKTDRRPLAVSTDWVLYATNESDPAAGVPEGLNLGAGLGDFKIAGFAPMESVAELLVDRATAKQVKAVVEAVEGTDDNEGA